MNKILLLLITSLTLHIKPIIEIHDMEYHEPSSVHEEHQSTVEDRNEIIKQNERLKAHHENSQNTVNEAVKDHRSADSKSHSSDPSVDLNRAARDKYESLETIVNEYNKAVNEYNNLHPHDPKKLIANANEVIRQGTTLSDLQTSIKNMHAASEKASAQQMNQNLRTNKSQVENDFLDALDAADKKKVQDKKDAQRAQEEAERAAKSKANKEVIDRVLKREKEEAAAKKEQEAAFHKEQKERIEAATRDANRLPEKEQGFFDSIMDFFTGKTKSATNDLFNASNDNNALPKFKEALKDLNREQRLRAINDAITIKAKTNQDLQNFVKQLNDILPKNQQLAPAQGNVYTFTYKK